MRPRQIFDQNFTSNNIANKALYASTPGFAGWRSDTFRILDQIPVRTIGSATWTGLDGLSSWRPKRWRRTGSRPPSRRMSLCRVPALTCGADADKNDTVSEKPRWVLTGSEVEWRLVGQRERAASARGRATATERTHAAIKVRSSQIHGSTVTIRARPMRAACKLRIFI